MTDKNKLEKLKKLADAMYYAAQYLTTDASRLHKAMDEYHKFIVHEYIEEPIELKEMDLEDSIKESLAQKYIDYTFKRHNIDPESKEGQLIYYAYMHGMNQCLTQLKTQKREKI